MALINCPECGGQVSSNTNQCIHCGCKYSVCPECGGVYVGEVEVCPTCGYKMIAKDQKSSKKNGKQGNSETVTDITEIWQNRSYIDKIVIRSIKIASVLLSVLVFVLICIAYIYIEFWDGSLESILEIKDLSKKSHALITTSCIVGVLIPIIGNIGEVYMQIMCGEWMRKNQLDFKSYLSKMKNQVEIEELPTDWNFENFSSAAYLSVVPHDKSIKIAKYIVTVIAAILISVTVGVCLTQNIDEFFRYKLYEDSFNFKFAAMIAAIIFIVCYIIASIAFEKVFNKRKENWLQTL